MPRPKRRFLPVPHNKAPVGVELPFLLAKKGDAPCPGLLTLLRFGRTLLSSLPVWQGCEASSPCGQTASSAPARHSRHPPPSRRRRPSLLPTDPPRQDLLMPIEQALRSWLASAPRENWCVRKSSGCPALLFPKPRAASTPDFFDTPLLYFAANVIKQLRDATSARSNAVKNR